VDDAYTYAFERMQTDEAQQTPQGWLHGAEGRILPARSPAGIVLAPRSDSRSGSRNVGSEVRTLQEALAREGLLAPDLAVGHFGTRTIQAYAARQRRLGLGGLADDGVAQRRRSGVARPRGGASRPGRPLSCVNARALGRR
jgi:hypothetical protein